MSDPAAPPGWYPDPQGTGGQRYYDGAAWTPHRWPPASAPGFPGVGGGGTGGGWWAPPWKGAALGRPALGPGSLATPGKRLTARLLDLAVLAPVYAVVIGITLLIVAPHVGRVFPPANTDPNASTPTPGFVWLYVAFFTAAAFGTVLAFLYEAVAIGGYGRTLGKHWMHVRAVRLDGSPVGWGRAFGRVGVATAAGFVGLPGLLDPLWCLWDDNVQCLHDKAVGTIVINDPGAW